MQRATGYLRGRRTMSRCRYVLQGRMPRRCSTRTTLCQEFPEHRGCVARHRQDEPLRACLHQFRLCRELLCLSVVLGVHIQRCCSCLTAGYVRWSLVVPLEGVPHGLVTTCLSPDFAGEFLHSNHRQIRQHECGHRCCVPEPTLLLLTMFHRYM